MIKRIIFITILTYVAAGIWFNSIYNWPPPVDQVSFKTFKVNVKDIPAEQIQAWEKEARTVKGVTALTLNPESEILAVSVKKEHMLDKFIENSVAQNGNLNIQAMEIASDGSGGCPYHRTLDQLAFLFKWPYISQSY